MNRLRIAPPRIDFVDRQPMSGSDMRAATSFLDAQRARHVRGAHLTWGVALGFEIDVLRRSWPHKVSVGPGLAYSPAGHELLLDRTVELPIPAEAVGVVVVAIGAGGAAPCASVRLATSTAPIRPRHEVPLAEIDIASGAVSLNRRAHARTMAPPHIAGARVEAGAAPASGATYAYTVTVDMSAAGFESAPNVQVQPAVAASAATMPSGVLGPLCEVGGVLPTRFSLTVRYVASDPASASWAAQLTRQVLTNQFAFDWVGVTAARRAAVGDVEPPPQPVV